MCRLFPLLMATMFCLFALPPALCFAEQDTAAARSAPRTVKVLTVGNSFAENACQYLQQIADSAGEVKLVIGKANLGGCSLERHAKLAAESARDPEHKPYRDSFSGTNRMLSLQAYLQAEPWDFVTVQQVSSSSFKPETFEPYLTELTNLIREHAPQAQLLVHETWAYRPDAPQLKQEQISQADMYERLRATYAAAAERTDGRIIPVGTAFQHVRNTPGREVLVVDPDYNYKQPEYPQLPRQTNSLVKGWSWRKTNDGHKLGLDFKHGNTAGCYLAGLVWYEVLTGHDARETSFLPNGLSEIDARFYREVAHEVVQQQTAVSAK